MKQLYSYLECEMSIPSNTLGMGNPGIIDGSTITELVPPLFDKKQKKYATKYTKTKIKK